MSAGNNMNNLENEPTVFEAIVAETFAVDKTTTHPLLVDDGSSSDCCICFEFISSKTNNCTTPCGHQFCFKCMAKTLARSNACPCCRAPLQEEEDEDDEIDLDDESDDDDDDYDEDDDADVDGELETVVKMFTLKGYTINDVLAMLTGRTSKIDTKYTKEYIDQLDTDLDDICHAADSIAVIAKAVKESARERAERAMFELEDRRV
jgi:hypothetical protein